MRDSTFRALVNGMATAEMFPLLHAYLNSAEALTPAGRDAIINELNDYYVGDTEPEDLFDEAEQ
jgi:hypothetical protein